MIEITRFGDTVSIAAASSAATTTPRVAFGGHSGGVVLIAHTGGCTQIQWHGAAGAEALPLPLYASGAAVTSAVVVGAVVMPDAVFALPFVVPVVSGGTSCAMTVCMKG